MSLDRIAALLGADADSLLNHKAVIPASRLHLPGPDSVERLSKALGHRSLIPIRMDESGCALIGA